MIKKYVLAGAIVAGMITVVNAGAPAVMKPYMPIFKGTDFPVEDSLQRIVRESKDGIRSIENKVRRLEEEQELVKTDEIYRTIYSIYNNSRLNIPPYLTKNFLRQIVKLESSDYWKAVGSMGERGYTQMTKEAWYEVSKENFEKNAFIPKKNITASIKYFLLIDDFCRRNYPNWQKLSDVEKIRMAVASYNGGKENLFMLNWDISKMKPITKRYVEKINKVMDSILPN